MHKAHLSELAGAIPVKRVRILHTGSWWVSFISHLSAAADTSFTLAIWRLDDKDAARYLCMLQPDTLLMPGCICPSDIMVEHRPSSYLAHKFADHGAAMPMQRSRPASASKRQCHACSMPGHPPQCCVVPDIVVQSRHSALCPGKLSGWWRKK
jgi:hypothetical protein